VLRRFNLFTLIVFLAFSSFMFADQVTLKNGDRLTGTIVKSDGKTLVLHTEAVGDVTIQFAAITDIKTEQQLHVSLKGGKTAVGPVTTSDGKIEIATKTSGTVEAPKDDVTLIRNDAEQAAYDKSLHPGLRHGWNGGASVGFSIARGNSDTENLALAFNAVHTTLNDKITLYANSIYTKSDLPPPSTTSANLEQGGLRYDRNINPRTFAFGAADFQANALQYLDLRQVYTGGFGYHAIKSDATTLNFLAGINFTHETYSNGALIQTAPPVFESYGVTNKYAALTLGEELMHKLGKSTVITQNFYMFPDLSDTSNYRGTFNLGTVTKISKSFGWQNSFSDIYVSNPPVGARKNDLVITTGLNYSFVH
jgi:putative salt-induced outer membrane protein